MLNFYSNWRLVLSLCFIILATTCIHGFVGNYKFKLPRCIPRLVFQGKSYSNPKFAAIQYINTKLHLRTDLSADDFLEILTDIKTNKDSAYHSSTEDLDLRSSKTLVDNILGAIYNKTFEMEQQKRDPEKW
jgi:hypothetical protein